MIHR
jgi:hypothetical protein